MNPIHIAPVYGLVLVGGMSSRMGKNKWELRYHGKTQLEYCYELLTPFCSKVFLSTAPKQPLHGAASNFPKIEDAFGNIGPAGGLFSAMSLHLGVAWLLLACDLPGIDREAILTLCNQRNPGKQVTAYHRKSNDSLEPLCAIYEPILFLRLKEMIQANDFSLSKLISNASAKRIGHENQSLFMNVNTPEEYQRALKEIGEPLMRAPK